MNPKAPVPTTPAHSSAQNVPTVAAQDLQQVCNGVPYLNTMEIAERAGMRHGDVMRLVRRELSAIEVDERKFASVYAAHSEGLLRITMTQPMRTNRRPCLAQQMQFGVIQGKFFTEPAVSKVQNGTYSTRRMCSQK